jgi:hypothetical protein
MACRRRDFYRTSAAPGSGILLPMSLSNYAATLQGMHVG